MSEAVATVRFDAVDADDAAAIVRAWSLTPGALVSVSIIVQRSVDVDVSETVGSGVVPDEPAPLELERPE